MIDALVQGATAEYRASSQGSPAVSYSPAVGTPAISSGVAGQRRHAGLRLVALSGLMLFIELTLIRWLGSEIPYLSYFSNFVLLGSFLGIGLGFLRGAPFDAFRFVPAALALLVGCVLAAPISVSHTNGSFILVGASLVGLPSWVVLPFVFVAVAVVMYLVASEVAAAFARFAPLDAYRFDILGSILGIAVFTGLSFTGTPPFVWAW
jgi:hypothetical protein